MRIGLGNAQMLFAAGTVVALLVTGVTIWTLTLAGVTVALTLTSILLYRDFLGLGRR